LFFSSVGFGSVVMLACVEVFKTSVLQLAPRSPTVRVRKVTFGNVIALLKVSHFKGIFSVNYNPNTSPIL